MSFEVHDKLIYAAFFFIDIVGLSNPILSTETQRMKIKILNETINDCETFHSYSKENLLVLPTGDGMLIGFKKGLEHPLKLAIEFQKKIFDYNKKVTSLEKIETRIGCHLGHVFAINGRLWEPEFVGTRSNSCKTDHGYGRCKSYFGKQ